MRRLVALVDGLPPAPFSALGREQDPNSYWGTTEELLAKIVELLDMSTRGEHYIKPLKISRPKDAKKVEPAKPVDVRSMLAAKLGTPIGPPPKK